MIGAIAGDVIGSVYEGSLAPAKDFPLFVPQSQFTDDTVLTVAVASAVRLGLDYGAALRHWGRRYPFVPYGGMFRRWLRMADPRPYQSFGNGSAMRVSPVGWAFDDMASVLREARRSAEVTHDHPEGIKGAQAVAAAVLLARTGRSKDEIRACMTEHFGYDCRASLDDLRGRGPDLTCQGTVPPAVVAFLESRDVEDAIRNAVSLGGDADTLACIAGAIAEAFYGGVPAELRREALARLDDVLREEVFAFARSYRVPLLRG